MYSKICLDAQFEKMSHNSFEISSFNQPSEWSKHFMCIVAAPWYDKFKKYILNSFWDKGANGVQWTQKDVVSQLKISLQIKISSI